MTILNLETDGLHAQLVTAFRAVVAHGPFEIEDLKRICAIDSSILSHWTTLGLFDDSGGSLKLSASFPKKRGESLDTLSDRLPSVCRRLLLDESHCQPFWPTLKGKEFTDAGTGRAADFARATAWILSQDIYSFPSGGSADTIDPIESAQMSPGKAIFINTTRWPALRFWARFLGFGVGFETAFLVDPTVAVREELPVIFSDSSELPADLFVKELASRLPVFDFGKYREDVESVLNEGRWRRPPDGHLSMSLSLALRRLDLDNTIKLKTQSDAGQGFALCGRQYRTWDRFTHIEYKGAQP